MEVMRVGSSSGLVVAVLSSLATTVGIKKQSRQAAMDTSRMADRSSLTAGERGRIIFVVCTVVTQ